MARDNSKSKIENLESAIESAQRALELTDEDARTDTPIPRDYVRAHWLLGAAYRAKNELTLSEENLSKAISMCRQINLVEVEADILLELAKLRYTQDEPEETKALAEEALLITERYEYVLQGADVHLFLATLSLEGVKLQVESELSDKEAARLHAQKALELATCDGPPYYYKVAYEEAERFLENLKEN